MNEKKYQTLQEEEEKFYSELDEKASHKSCCTCQTLVVFFFVLLAITSGIVFYFYWQITRGGTQASDTNVVSSGNFQSKIDNPSLDQNNQFQIILTSDDLTNLLAEGFSTENFILKEIKVSINPSQMLIYGTLIKPINSKVIITAKPEVKDEKIAFLIENISAGSINLPSFLSSKMSENVTSLFDKKLSVFYQKYSVEKVVLEDNQIYIFGQKKK